MDTTAAAAQAHVTVATIRTWCRRNVIAAIKRAGRWTIDAASLAHRIALGRERANHRTTAMTETPAELSTQCLARAADCQARRDALKAAAKTPRERTDLRNRTKPTGRANRALEAAWNAWHAAGSAYLHDDPAHQAYAREQHAEAIERQARADELLATL